MTTRIGLCIGALVLAGIALWHPAPHPAFESSVAPASAANSPAGRRHDGSTVSARSDSVEPVVYVAGAVRRPGLYRVRAGERAADAVAQAGGVTSGADGGGVNLAAHVADGDEVYVPALGESGARGRSTYGARRRSGRSHRRDYPTASVSLAPASIDVNVAGTAALADVPGIGAAIAARIVEMRTLDGSFTSLDELLDVAGMTQTRLERARPFLRLSRSRS